MVQHFTKKPNTSQWLSVWNSYQFGFQTLTVLFFLYIHILHSFSINVTTLIDLDGSSSSRGSELPSQQDGRWQPVDGDGAHHCGLLLHWPHRSHVRGGKTEKRDEGTPVHLCWLLVRPAAVNVSNQNLWVQFSDTLVSWCQTLHKLIRNLSKTFRFQTSSDLTEQWSSVWNPYCLNFRHFIVHFAVNFGLGG